MTDTNDKVIEKQPDGTWTENQENKETKTVNMEEFESIKKSNQEAQKLIKQYKDKETEQAKTVQEKKDKDLQEKWEFETLKTQWETDKQWLEESKEKLLKANETYLNFIKTQADKQLDAMKERFKDNWDDVVKLVWDLEDPINVMEKWPIVDSLLWDGKKTVKADNGTPKWQAPDRKKTLQEKAKSEWLSKQEKRELMNLMIK